MTLTQLVLPPFFPWLLSFKTHEEALYWLRPWINLSKYSDWQRWTREKLACACLKSYPPWIEPFPSLSSRLKGGVWTFRWAWALWPCPPASLPLRFSGSRCLQGWRESRASSGVPGATWHVIGLRVGSHFLAPFISFWLQARVEARCPTWSFQSGCFLTFLLTPYPISLEALRDRSIKASIPCTIKWIPGEEFFISRYLLGLRGTGHVWVFFPPALVWT